MDQKSVGRQSGSNATAGPTVLSTGAVVGIAIVGSAMLFGALTVVVLRYLRFCHKQKNRTRDLDLCDDTEEEILDPLSLTRPSENKLVSKASHDQSKAGMDSLPKELLDQRFQGLVLEKAKLMPQPRTFEITGVRDSWPLFGWVESPSAFPTSSQRYPIINMGSADRRISYSAFPLSSDGEPSRPKPTLSKPSSNDRSNDGRLIQLSRHSTRSSVTSRKLSSSRTSISNNQLTSILRSTSQRLREAQGHPLSRSMSVMSQVSGAPPKVQPPSPPRDQQGGSREALIETDSISLIDSVHSSVLNSVFQTPNQNKMVTRTAVKILGKENEASPTSSAISEPYSLCPSKTPDLLIPATLTSPSKRHASTDQRYEINISSKNIPIAIGSPNGRKSLPTSRSNRMSHYFHSSVQCGSADDPFVSAHGKANSASNTNSIKGPRPLIAQKVVAEQNSSFRGHESITSPLRAVTGNERSPTKLDCSAIKLLENQDNPFQWSPQCSPSLVSSPSKKQMGIRPKGHRRRRTVRLSHLSQPTCVGVVLEEPEYLIKSTHQEGAEAARKLSLASPEELRFSSGDAFGDQVSCTRPPSIPIFQPFFAIPSVEAREETQTSLDGPYSATMPFYDYYSSHDTSRSDQLRIPEPRQSPTPSIKLSRRRACDFSIDMTHAKDFALLEATPLTLQKETLHTSSRPAPEECPTVVRSNDATAKPALTTHFSETASPPYTVKDSIATSVSLLRRMNSEVSTYSTRSILSDRSNGSPTFPAPGGDRLNSTKRVSESTVNYLSLGVKTPSPIAKRGRTRLSQFVEKTRDIRQIPIHDDDSQHCNGLGLQLSSLEDPPPNLENPETLSSICGQADWPLTQPDWPSRSPKRPSPPERTKTPTAQLKPNGASATSQEDCYSCKKPLSPVHLNLIDSGLASRYHKKCFECSTCHEPLRAAFSIGKKPYCRQHYYEKVNEICDVVDTSSKMNPGSEYINERWSQVMTTPLTKSVRHESQLEMPSPKDGSPKSIIKWRGSLGLYDEMGFLRSSPDRGHELDCFELGTVDDLTMGT